MNFGCITTILFTLVKLLGAQDACILSVLAPVDRAVLSDEFLDVVSQQLQDVSLEERANCKQQLLHLYGKFPEKHTILQWIQKIDIEIEANIHEKNVAALGLEKFVENICLRLCGNSDCAFKPEEKSVNPPSKLLVFRILDIRRQLGKYISEGHVESEKMSELADVMLKTLHWTNPEFVPQPYDDCFRLGSVFGVKVPCPVSMPFKQERYKPLKYLSKGRYGAVFKAMDTRLNRPVALKRGADASTFNYEINFLRKYNGIIPGLVQYFDSFAVVSENDKTYYLVMELIEGVKWETFYSETLKSKYFIDMMFWFHKVLLAILEFHKRGVSHNDLHSQNILISNTNEVRFIDPFYDPIILDALRMLEPCRPFPNNLFKSRTGPPVKSYYDLYLSSNNLRDRLSEIQSLTARDELVLGLPIFTSLSTAQDLIMEAGGYLGIARPDTTFWWTDYLDSIHGESERLFLQNLNLNELAIKSLSVEIIKKHCEFLCIRLTGNPDCQPPQSAEVWSYYQGSGYPIYLANAAFLYAKMISRHEDLSVMHFGERILATLNVAPYFRFIMDATNLKLIQVDLFSATLRMRKKVEEILSLSDDGERIRALLMIAALKQADAINTFVTFEDIQNNITMALEHLEEQISTFIEQGLSVPMELLCLRISGNKECDIYERPFISKYITYPSAELLLNMRLQSQELFSDRVEVTSKEERDLFLNQNFLVEQLCKENPTLYHDLECDKLADERNIFLRSYFEFALSISDDDHLSDREIVCFFATGRHACDLLNRTFHSSFLKFDDSGRFREVMLKSIVTLKGENEDLLALEEKLM